MTASAPRCYAQPELPDGPGPAGTALSRRCDRRGRPNVTASDDRFEASARQPHATPLPRVRCQPRRHSRTTNQRSATAAASLRFTNRRVDHPRACTSTGAILQDSSGALVSARSELRGESGGQPLPRPATDAANHQRSSVGPHVERPTARIRSPTERRRIHRLSHSSSGPRTPRECIGDQTQHGPGAPACSSAG